VPHDEWYDDGRWIGPPDLRLFLRENWPFAAFSCFVMGAIAIVISVDLAGSLWVGVPLGVVAWVLSWVAQMFAFSRGWIAEGD
jgi:hypothetical protein